MSLVVYSDYVCPFCYLAEAMLARVRADVEVEVEHRAYELRPAPAPLPDVRAGFYLQGWLSTVLPLARALEVPVTETPPIMRRSRKAHEAMAYARENGAGDAMHTALFRAHFVDGRDIGRIDVLVEIGSALGLDPTGLKVALDIDAHTERVEADEREALELGLEGVPAFRHEDEILVGLQPLETLRSLARRAGG